MEVLIEMNLPLINPMKPNDKNRSQQVEQFGLGIQVFKIDHKADRHEPAHTRKAIQLIENPKNEAWRVPPTLTQNSLKVSQKPSHLPSLSTDKKLSATYIEPRRKTLEKRTPQSTSKAGKDTKEVKEMKEIKEERPKPKPFQTKEPAPLKEVKEKEIIHLNWIPSLNQIVQLEIDLETAEADNEKQIRRLKKEKENVDQDELQKRLNCRQLRTGLVQTIVQAEDPFFSAPSQWEEWNIVDYVQGKSTFPRYDVECEQQP